MVESSGLTIFTFIDSMILIVGYPSDFLINLFELAAIGR